MTMTPPANPPATPSGRHAAETEEPSVGQLVAEASTHLSTIIQGEVELAKLELRSTVKNAGAGVGFFGAAAVLLAFSLTFGLIALAEGLCALGIWRWASFLIVFGFLLVLPLLLLLTGGLIARRRRRR